MAGEHLEVFITTQATAVELVYVAASTPTVDLNTDGLNIDDLNTNGLNIVEEEA